MLEGYAVLSLIYESETSIIHRATRDQDGVPVILKSLKGQCPSPEEYLRYRHEYQITRQLDNAAGVIRALGLSAGDSLTIVLEDFGGESLKSLIALHPLPLRNALALAIHIARALDEIHAARVIHKDINPSNIVCNLQKDQVKIIDFGISTCLPQENPAPQSILALEGTLAYLSPEQTGRMNRAVDQRTDTYSLGATLYHLLVGQPPFSSEDPMELVHCHMAKQPIAPHVQNPEIPQVLSEMVLRLMAKVPEDRYQTMRGLVHDLNECLVQLSRLGEVRHFEIGARDRSERLMISQKLYGMADIGV